MENDQITPKEFFDIIKSKKDLVDHEKLKQYYEHCLVLIKKFEITGQKNSLEKLKYHITCMEKEMKLIDMGITTYINFKDIKEFIEKVEDRQVLIVELKNFPREVPDEIVEVIKKTKDIFSELYVLFTDYTGELKEKMVEEKKKEKDPILFGAFSNNKTKLERFYYLGDWVDEYCDLTLEKLISKGVKTNTISEKTLDDIKADINSYIAPKEPEKVSGLDDSNFSKFYISSTQMSHKLEPKIDVQAFEVVEKLHKKTIFEKVKTWLIK